jgi:MarR family transcriptional regulator for hemolysin
MDLDVLSTPGHLISLAARGFARLSEARLKPLGFGVGHLPVLVALQDGRAGTQRDLARFARIEQPPMAQMLARMERDGLIQRAPDPADGRVSRIRLTEAARARLPDAIAVLLRGNRDALSGFADEEAGLLVVLLTRLIANLDRIAGAEASPHAPIPETGKRTRPSVGRLIEAEPKSIKKQSRFARPRPSGRRREPR